jgi:SAM-dependent methyltransferase
MAAVPARLRWAVQLLQPPPGARLLEIGCGRGVAIGELLQAHPTCTVRGVDRSATAVDAAAQRLEAAVATGTVRLVQASLDELSLPGETFDLAFAVNVNAFWTAPAGRELAVLDSLLTPGAALHLFYEPPSADRLPRLEETLLRHLASGPFPEVQLTAYDEAGGRLLHCCARRSSRQGPTMEA